MDFTRVIPVLKVVGKTIADTWEASVVHLFSEGIQIKTEYDSPTALPSKDSTMIMVVNQPFQEPRIHLGFPGGLEDLWKYRMEVVEGVHDHWINPEEGKWTYTYHQRLFRYKIDGFVFPPVDQIDYIIKKLCEAPYTRRAQAVTWIPTSDPQTDDPPCLQRIWCRMIMTGENEYNLLMNTHWRSRDAYDAAFMNIFALTELQAAIAKEVSLRTHKKVSIGQYTDISDSYHIYGNRIHDFEERFCGMLEKRKFYDIDRTLSRTMNGNDPAVIESFAAAQEMIEKEQQTGQRGMSQ